MTPQPAVRLERVIDVRHHQVTGQPVPIGEHVRVRVLEGSGWAMTDETIRNVADLTRSAASVVVECHSGTDGAGSRLALRLPYDWRTLDEMEAECNARAPQDPTLF